MKVVLLQDIANFGKKGDIKDVSDGYARNFLIPKKLAQTATPQTLSRLREDKAHEEKKLEEEKKRALALKETLGALTLTFKIKVGEKGKPFGGVTPLKIIKELEKRGINLLKEQLPPESIKTTGEHVIKVKLPRNTAADLKILIKPEK